MSKETEYNFSIMENAEYRKQWDSLQNIKGKIDDIERQIQELNNRRTSEAVSARETQQIENILAGGEINNEYPVYNDSEMTELHQKRRLLRKAEAEQRSRLSKLETKVSNEIAENVFPQYKKIVEDLARAYCELALCVVEEMKFRGALNEGRVMYSGKIRAMPPRIGDDPREFTSNFAMWIKEAVDYGFIQPDLVPKELRDAWGERGGFKLGKNLISTAKKIIKEAATNGDAHA